MSLGREAHVTRGRVDQAQQNIALAGGYQVNVAAGRRGRRARRHVDAEDRVGRTVGRRDQHRPHAAGRDVGVLIHVVFGTDCDVTTCAADGRVENHVSGGRRQRIGVVGLQEDIARAASHSDVGVDLQFICRRGSLREQRDVATVVVDHGAVDRQRAGRGDPDIVEAGRSAVAVGDRYADESVYRGDDQCSNVADDDVARLRLGRQCVDLGVDILGIGTDPGCCAHDQISGRNVVSGAVAVRNRSGCCGKIRGCRRRDQTNRQVVAIYQSGVIGVGDRDRAPEVVERVVQGNVVGRACVERGGARDVERSGRVGDRAAEGGAVDLGVHVEVPAQYGGAAEVDRFGGVQVEVGGRVDRTQGEPVGVVQIGIVGRGDRDRILEVVGRVVQGDVVGGARIKRGCAGDCQRSARVGDCAGGRDAVGLGVDVEGPAHYCGAGEVDRSGGVQIEVGRRRDRAQGECVGVVQIGVIGVGDRDCALEVVGRVVQGDVVGGARVERGGTGDVERTGAGVGDRAGGRGAVGLSVHVERSADYGSAGEVDGS